MSPDATHGCDGDGDVTRRDAGDRPSPLVEHHADGGARELDGVARFDDRAEDYARWRPGYPAAVVTLLEGAFALPRPARVVDVGAGTGKLTEALLAAGHDVVAVEPGRAMREAGQAALGRHPRLRWVEGRAERTGLDAGCADLVVAAQAFHWFDAAAARREFVRLLGGAGPVALVWNDRRADEEAGLVADYERLLRRHVPAFAEVAERERGTERVHGFFAPGGCQEDRFDHEQVLDRDGLAGRALSASYVPRDGPAHDAFVAGLDAAFTRHAVEGRVRFRYRTRVFHGVIRAEA